MKSTTERFNAIKMSEGSISDIQRFPGTVQFRVSMACLRKDHPANTTGKVLRVFPCQFVFSGVLREEALAYDQDEVLWGPHPTPEFPLSDDIARTEYKKDHFYFHGYLGELQAEWRIYALSFVFSWENEEETDY